MVGRWEWKGTETRRNEEGKRLYWEMKKKTVSQMGCGCEVWCGSEVWCC